MTRSSKEREPNEHYKLSISHLCKIIAEERAYAKCWVGKELLSCQSDLEEFWSLEVFWSVHRHIKKSLSAERALRELIKNANASWHNFEIGTLGSMCDDQGTPITNVRERGDDGELLDIIHITLSDRPHDAAFRTRWDSGCGSCMSTSLIDDEQEDERSE